MKYASAHDLRRSFRTRRARRVMPAVLQKLMRHASIDTTKKYSVDLDVDDVVDQLWKAHGKASNGNSFRNTTDFEPTSTRQA